MTNIVLIKRSATANAVPTTGQLANGEIAINYADGNLFFKDSGGSVQTLASKKFVSVSGNVTGGNVNTGIVSATGNVIAGNVNTGIVSATGNVIAGNLNAAGLSLSSNVIGALVSAANITTTANIAGGYFIGNGSQLTGLPESYSNANVSTLLANFGSNTVSTSGNVTTGNLIVNGNITYVNSNVVTINDKFINVANNAATSGAANGGGLGVGPVDAEYATLTFNNGTTAWNTNIPLSVNGNVAGSYFVGNGSALTSITGANVSGTVANATYAVSAGSAGSAVTAEQITYAIQSNITGVGTLGNLSVTGNTTVGNLSTGGFVSATGNVTGGNLNASGLSLSGNVVSALNVTGNVNSANVNVTANIYAAGNIFANTGLGGTNITSAGYVSAIGNVVSGNVYTGNLSISGNVLSALGSSSNISTTANISANYFIGNGSQLTGITAIGGSKINNGTSEVNIGTANGNANISINGTSNVAVFADTGAYITGVVSATGNITSDGSIITGGTGTGNISGANLISAVSMSLSGQSRAASYITTGNITGANLTVGGGTVIVGNIVNGNGNAVGNIGSNTGYFNTVFAQSTTAIYADLAEWYSADADYPPGTVLSFGGPQEVTVTIGINDPKIAGVVSTRPAHVMNAGLVSEHTVMVALAGRVPTLVVGAVAPGDMMVSAGGGRAKACATPAMGTVIGKALQTHPGGQGMIEVVIGRI